MVVVAFTLVINTITAKGPIVFLALSQGSEGEIDGVILSKSSGSTDISSSGFNTYGEYLNFTQVLNI